GRGVAERDGEAPLRIAERDGVGTQVIPELVRALVPDSADLAQTAELPADRRGHGIAAVQVRGRGRRVIVDGERADEYQRARGDRRRGMGPADMGAGQELPRFEGFELQGTDVAHPGTSRARWPVRYPSRRTEDPQDFIGRHPAPTFAILRVGPD